MMVVCAWCQAEGLPYTVAEREPLDDRSVSHAACARHRAALADELERLRTDLDARD